MSTGLSDSVCVLSGGSRPAVTVYVTGCCDGSFGVE